MRCSEAEKLISSYIDGELDEQCSRELAGHIGQCSACAAHESQLRETTAVLASWPDIEPCLGFDALQARIEQGISQRKALLDLRGVPMPRWASAALAVASVAVGIVLGFATSNPIPAEAPTEQQVVSALGLHPYDDILEASITYAVEDNKSGTAKGEAQ